MVKKVRKVPMEPSPSTACYQVGEDPRARFRYQYLSQDYEELLKETEAKKRKLQMAKEKKLRLLAEVKFLRKKYQSLSKNPSQTALHILKKQFHKTTSSSSAGIVQPARSRVRNGVLFKGKNHCVVEAGKPSTSTLLDLNQISLPSAEDGEEFQTPMEPMKTEMLKRCSVAGGKKDKKFAICRDVGNNSNRVVKRKITWQDHVALKV